ncbi:unnamed protein product [marine sediment metagenome]|uniref:Uncharacterized protein n=1 Tax=marine sediment metagenome TaxID=412755 RepID=X0SRG0_9ZZZZ
MRYAQIKAGNRLHMVYGAGEGPDNEHLIRAGHISAPLCETRFFKGHFRMTINMPLGCACKNCDRVYRKRLKKESP